MRPSWFLALLGLSIILMTSTAGASVKPRILIIFDTSGSMLAGGDGSDLCGGAGKSSRMYQLKQAFFEVIQGMGSEEVDFALSTFPMMMNPAQTPQCYNQCQDANNFSTCSGHYYLAPSQDGEHSNPSSPSSSQLNGCKISSHSPLVQQNANCGAPSNPCSSWYMDMYSEVLKVPFGTGPEDVVVYFDQKENPGPVIILTNPEVRAGNFWYTPLGKSLFYAHGYFHKEVVPSITAYEKPCTDLVVALFTDGDETCNESTSDPFYPTKWAANLKNNLGVTVHTVAIDVNSSKLSGIAQSGGGTYYPVGGNTTALKQAFLDIIAKSLPPTEICNGLDDDCDNQVDEDFPLKGKPCNNGKLGVCFATGVYVCAPGGAGVVCNAPSPSGTPEVCNGLDDDCNGAIDDVKKTCSTDANCTGLGGAATCKAGQCACLPCVAQPEVCNGKDDDCDGKVDEDFTSSPCGMSLGECKPGMTQCVAGKVVCGGGTAPTNEICNGLDDDCDGMRDGMSDSCYTFPTGCTKDPVKGWVCQGFCSPGVMLCSAQQTAGGWTGVWGPCQGQIGPEKEICNGQDDDCDGTVDENAECPAGTQCLNGQCVTACGTGEFICPKGQLCKDGWCVKDPCDPQDCAASGGACKGGVCVDLCQGITCPSKYETCDRGACIDTSCYNPKNACPSGQLCIQGKCTPDPCAKVSCPGDHFCRGGSCIRICDTMACPAGETCKVVDQGGVPVARCVKDPCADKICDSPWVCSAGQCIQDPCATQRCDKGEVCVDGTCVADLCEGVACPEYFVCRQGMCEADNVNDTREILATGSGGLSCGVSSPGRSAPAAGAPLLVLLLCLGLLVGRRRA